MALNLFFLIYIAIAYVLFFKKIKASQRKVKTADNTTADRNDRKMRRRIAYIILTDMACWLPIIVMSIVAFAGHTIPDIAHPLSAIILLPINSLLNPIIYSRLDKKITKYLKGLLERNCTNLSSKNVTTLTTVESTPMSKLGNTPQNQEQQND